MATNISGNGLYWESGVRLDKLERDLKLMEGKIGQSVSNVQKEGDKLENVFNNAAKALGLFFTAQQGSQLVNAIIKVRGEFQQLEIAFGTMLGNKAKADKLMSEMVALAAKTPFGLQDVASGAKQLLAYGFAAEDITKNITMLGNVASGVGSQVGDLIYLYGTLKASGRVTQMDINQFAGRGIPIYAELAKVMGVTVEKVRELVGEGKVGFPQIEKAFQGMTEQGGMFFNLMEAQSKSLTGQISNLQDSIAQMFNEIGQSSEGVLSKGIEGIAYLVENYKEIGNVLTVLITTYGAYRAALILTNAIEIARYQTTLQYGASLTKVTTLKALATQATNLLSAAQTRLAAAFAANPVGLVITAIAGLAATYFVLRDNTTSAERAQKAFNETLKSVKDNTQELANKSRDLLNIINDNSKSLSQQFNAYTNLKSLYNGRLADLDLESFKLKTVEERQRAVNVALSEYTLEGLKAQKVKALDTIAEHGRIEQTQWENFKETMRDVLTMEDSRAKRLEDAINLEEMLTGEISRQEEQVRLAAMTDAQRLEYAKKQLEPLEMQIKSLETTAGQLERNNDGIIKIGSNLAALSIQHVINQYNQWLGLINSANAAIAGGVANARTVAVIDKEISDLKDLQKGASQNKGSFSFATGRYTKGYADYDKEIKQKESERRKITGEVDKAAVASAKRAATASNKAQRAATQEANREYDRQTALLVNKLNNEKSIYESFEKYRTALGVESANERYKGLIDTSINFETRLANEIAKLDAKKDKERLDKLKEMQADAANKKFENESQKRIQDAEKEKEQSQREIEDRVKAEAAAYKQVLDKAQDYYQQKKNLEDEFSLQIKGLENDRTNLTAQEYERRKKIIQDSYNETLKDLEFNNADIFRKLNKDIGRATKQELQILYNDLDGVIKSGKMRNAAGELVNIPPETLQRLKQARDNINQLLKDYTNLQKKVDALASLAPYIQDIADSIGQLGDSNTSSILSGVASGISTLTSAMKNFNVEGGTLKFTGDSIDAYTMAAQFVLQAVSGIINAAAQRKAKLQEFYNDMTAMQNSYNLALLEEIRLRGELRDSVFLKTYSDKVKSGLAAEVETVKQYNKAIQDLQKASVKTGTMKKADWDKIAKNTVSGVAAGAAIGSVVPVIGTAVGAIVGGVVGFVSGLFSKKRVDVYSGLLQTYPDLLAADGKLNKSRAQALLQGGLLNDQSKQAVQNALNLADAYEKAKEQIEGVISELAGQLGNDIMASLVENYKQGGKDAGEAFLEGFKPTLAKISQQLLFEALFADSLKGLQDEIKASFLTSGTDDMARIIADWGQKNKGTAEAYVEGLRTFNDVFSQMGYKDIFGTATSQGSTKSKNSLSGAYAQASQESIDLLSGQTMAFKIAQLETNGHLVQMKDYAFRGLDYAERTANNTANTVARLDTIISKMNNNANNALAAGL